MMPPFGGGMSPPTTAGSLHSVNAPMGAPYPPPGMWGSGPPTAASMGGGPPMAGGSPMPMGPPMSGMPGGMPPMSGMPHKDPHMGGPMNGFGPQMHGYIPEVRHAPHRNRPENKELPEHRKVVKEHQVHLPDGSSLPAGSTKFDLYGALEDLDAENLDAEREALARRRRLNCVPALNALFLPWVMFLGIYSISSFYIRYSRPGLVFLINVTTVVCTMLYAYLAFQGRRIVGPERAFYPTYMAVMLLIAATLGWLLGDLNFWFNMQPAYNMEHLATYNNVNPSTSMTRKGQTVPTKGKRYQDAGTVYFEHNAVIDVNRSMSFKMGDLYCVAPIVDPNCKKNCGYDFWAVGINCCAEDVADFRCGEYNNPAAKNGLRLMHDEQRPNFRLAVLQAEGVHKIVSNHPIFFYWLHDPVKELNHIKRNGFKGFVLLMIVSFFGYALAAAYALKWARTKFGPASD